MLLCPAPIEWGIKYWWSSSVCPSVTCLILNQEQNGVGSWKLAGSPYHRWPVTSFRDLSQGQRSRLPGQLTLWLKICHILRTGRPTNFTLGIQMEYNDSHRWHAQWPPPLKLWVAVQVTITGSISTWLQLAAACRAALWSTVLLRVALHSQSMLVNELWIGNHLKT